MSNAAAILANTRAALERLTPATGRPLLLYALYTISVFGLFLLATFPYELAIRQGLRQALGPSITSDVAGAQLGWNLTTTIRDLQLLPTGATGPKLLSVQALRVRPSILGLVRGSVFPITTAANLYGGTLEGTLDPRPESFDIDARVTGLDLSRYGGLAHFSGGTLRGRLNLAVALIGDRTAPTTLNGQVSLTGVGIGLEGLDVRGVVVPDLHFGQLQVGGTVTDGRVDITQLSGDGSEIDLAGSGHLLLRDPLNTSLLNLQVTLTPTTATPQGLRMAIKLIPGEEGPDDGRILQISGPLGAPQLR